MLAPGQLGYGTDYHLIPAYIYTNFYSRKPEIKVIYVIFFREINQHLSIRIEGGFRYFYPNPITPLHQSVFKVNAYRIEEFGRTSPLSG